MAGDRKDQTKARAQPQDSCGSCYRQRNERRQREGHIHNTLPCLCSSCSPFPNSQSFLPCLPPLPSPSLSLSKSLPSFPFLPPHSPPSRLPLSSPPSSSLVKLYICPLWAEQPRSAFVQNSCPFPCQLFFNFVACTVPCCWYGRLPLQASWRPPAARMHCQVDPLHCTP